MLTHRSENEDSCYLGGVQLRGLGGEQSVVEGKPALTFGVQVHYPLLRFKEEGWSVILVSGHPAGMKFTGKNGYPVTSTHCIADVTPDSIDALIVPGGWAPDYWRRDERILKLVRDLDAAKKPIGSICHGIITQHASIFSLS